jgi:hypothetical protein
MLEAMNQDDTSIPPPIDSSYYTLGVIKGDEQKYTVTQMYMMYRNGTIVNQSQVGAVLSSRLFLLRSGQELLVRVGGISESSFTYDLFSSEYPYNKSAFEIKLGTYNISRKYQVKYSVLKFITTTNKSLLEDILTDEYYDHYQIKDGFLNITQERYDYGYKGQVKKIWFYDLDSGWLLSLHYKCWNDTHVIKEYEIVIDKISRFWMDRTSIQAIVPGVYIILAILFLWVRRKKKGFLSEKD